MAELDFVTLAAWGNWTQEKDLGERVLVLACPGGRDERHQYREPQRYFMVPKDEYRAQWREGFRIDLARHEALDDNRAADLLNRLYERD